MTDALALGSPDTLGFLVTYNDGTERYFPCQRAIAGTSFVQFWRVNENWSDEALMLAVNTAGIRMITPAYRDGSASAALRVAMAKHLDERKSTS